MTQTIGTMFTVVGVATLAVAVLDWNWQAALVGILVLAIGLWFELPHNFSLTAEPGGGAE